MKREDYLNCYYEFIIMVGNGDYIEIIHIPDLPSLMMFIKEYKDLIGFDKPNDKCFKIKRANSRELEDILNTEFEKAVSVKVNSTESNDVVSHTIIGEY